MTPQSGKADVLLPCPFCGPGQSQIDLWFDDVSQRWRVGCGRCGCSTGTSPRDKTQAPAIAAWNRRPTAPSGDALTDEEIIRIACDAVVREDEAAGLTPLDPYLDRRDRAAAKHKLLSTAFRILTAAGYEIRRPSPAHGEGALREALGKLIRAYVGLLAKGYERITDLGGSCDLVEVMERGDPALRDARSALASSAGELVQELHELPALSDNTVRQALEEAHKAVKLLEDLTACGSDDDYVSGVQSKITAALTALSAPDGGTSLQKAQTTPPLHPHRPA